MSLPDQKYINHVRDALWSRSSRASIMIGSGFSKFAQPTRPDAGELPVWDDLARGMFDKVHPPSLGGSQHIASDSASDPSNALRVAQDYKEEFGRSSLHLFLQQRVRDGDFNPGEFHSRLLKLPWRDVFTTNWDTLLERTRLSVPERPYSVVHNKDEIPLSDQPRIVKLHGSLNGHYPLVVAEEDYLAYPQRHAPFVNTVQQAMMETVFCLIGFSGSDPNFLKWSTWVQDNLGESAPRIYIAGWLELSADAREYLQARNVVAIDLAQHEKALQWPTHLRHRYATDWILRTLENGRPYDVSNWPAPVVQIASETPPHIQPVEVLTSDNPIEEPWPTSISDDIQKLEDSVREILTIWAKNRKVYPGWLMAPLEVRSSIIGITLSWQSNILQVLNGLSLFDRLGAIHELLWRHEVTLEPISPELESIALDTLALIDCEAKTDNGGVDPHIMEPEVRAAWREVAFTLVTTARRRLDERLWFQRTEAVKQFLGDDPDVSHRLHHERCLWAVWSLDFAALDGLLETWSTENCDPMWMLRKAALLSEIGRDQQAGALNEHAISEIRRFPVDDRSVAGSSREGWALWSTIDHKNRLEVFKRWNELAPRKCDAYAEKSEIASTLSTKEESSAPPSFDIATVQDSWSVRFEGGSPSAPAYRAIRLSEVAGLPVATPTALPPRAAAADILQLAADRLVNANPELSVRLILRSCVSEKDETLLRVLSRTRIAMMQDDSVQRLVADCIKVIDYGLPRGWIKRIRVAIEVLSRLVLRERTGSVLRTFDYALEFYRNRRHQVTSHVWVASPLKDLLGRAWEALPQDQRTRRALDLLGAPIVGLDGFTTQIEEHYPDPGELISGDVNIRLPDRSEDNEAQWRGVVSLLLRALRAGGEPRRRAATRLVPMTRHGLLTESETLEVADALWAVEHTPSDSLPSNTSLHDWAYLILPEPKPHLAAKRFRHKWLSGKAVKSRLDVTGSDGVISVNIGVPPKDPTQLEDTLWNVGAAITGLRTHGSQLELTDSQRKDVVCLVSRWAKTPVISHPHLAIQHELLRHTLRVIEGLAPILSQVEIPAPVGESLFEKLRGLTESGTPAFGPIGGLVQVIPHRTTELAAWLRTGLASGDRDIATGAVSGLASWLRMSNAPGSSIQSPTADLLREVGLIIAARRKESLSHALQLAKWVFDEGSDDVQYIILNSVLEGLDYLVEELRYDRNQDDYVTNLRWRCALLASSMAKAGLEYAPVVSRWLELASGDPYPEIRYAIEYDQGEDADVQASRWNS